MFAQGIEKELTQTTTPLASNFLFQDLRHLVLTDQHPVDVQF